MASGGSRDGAGRPKKFTFKQKLALASEVTAIQQDENVSRVEALKILHHRTLLRPEWKSYQRYLTPKFFDEDIMSILQTSERDGVLSVLPTLDDLEI